MMTQDEIMCWLKAVAETYQAKPDPIAFTELVGSGAVALLSALNRAEALAPFKVERATALIDFEDAEEGPWFAGRLCGDDEDHRVISVGPYSLDDRPNKDHHYEDTICEVWDNGNLASDPMATARLIAAAPALAKENAMLRARLALLSPRDTR